MDRCVAPHCVNGTSLARDSCAIHRLAESSVIHTLVMALGTTTALSLPWIVRTNIGQNDQNFLESKDGEIRGTY